MGKQKTQKTGAQYAWKKLLLRFWAPFMQNASWNIWISLEPILDLATLDVKKLYILSEIFSWPDDNMIKESFVLFADFVKAFDTVDHKVLKIWYS